MSISRSTQPTLQGSIEVREILNYIINMPPENQEINLTVEHGASPSQILIDALNNVRFYIEKFCQAGGQETLEKLNFINNIVDSYRNIYLLESLHTVLCNIAINIHSSPNALILMRQGGDILYYRMLPRIQPKVRITIIQLLF